MGICEFAINWKTAFNFCDWGTCGFHGYVGIEFEQELYLPLFVESARLVHHYTALSCSCSTLLPFLLVWPWLFVLYTEAKRTLFCLTSVPTFSIQQFRPDDNWNLKLGKIKNRIWTIEKILALGGHDLSRVTVSVTVPWVSRRMCSKRAQLT